MFVKTKIIKSRLPHWFLIFLLMMSLGFRESIPLNKNVKASTGVDLGKNQFFLSNNTAEVLVHTDKHLYSTDEPIRVTISNHLAQAIYTPAGKSSCSILTVEQMKKGAWHSVGTCNQSSNFAAVEIPPHGQLHAVLNEPSKAFVIQTVRPDGPVAPDVFEGSVKRLPPPDQWKPGDPVKEVPQGMSPPKNQRPPLSLVGETLSPGIYRLELTFAVDGDRSRVRIANSQEFKILRQ